MIQEAGHVDMELPEDLLAGLPLTEVLGVGGSGVDIPGGQRVHGKPGNGGPLPLSQLREQCVSVNHATICAAKAREYSSEPDLALALEIWRQAEKDVSDGRAGPPVPLEEVDLSDVLLVDSFGIWEQSRVGGQPKARTIRNFRSNHVNDYAWMP